MKIAAFVAAVALSSAAQAITIDPNEYFAYGPTAYGWRLLISHAPCQDKSAPKEWKKASLDGVDGACWRDVSTQKYGRNLKFCSLQPGTGKLTNVCGEAGLSDFIKTDNLPKHAF